MTSTDSVAAQQGGGAATSGSLRRSSALLDVANVEVIYDQVVLVLRGLSLAVPAGQIVALLGANGAGKSADRRSGP
ncbi:MAG: ATP-binding cassette domain-containing protein [Pseudonocardiaceae bacterium]